MLRRILSHIIPFRALRVLRGKNGLDQGNFTAESAEVAEDWPHFLT